MNSITAMASAIAGNPSGNFALATSYNATPDGTYAHSPIPTIYSGNFQGFGNTISHLKISDTITGENVGLFFQLNSGGSISNLRTTNIVVGGGAEKSVGGLVAITNGMLFGDSVNGSISAGGRSNVGVLAGTNNGTVSSSHSLGSVRDTGQYTNSVGGLVGYSSSIVENSDSSATVTAGGSGGSLAGGLVGQQADGAISNSFASGNVSSYSIAGGLLGYNTGSTTLTGSYATGNVSGGAGAGGLVGYFGASEIPSSSISNCHATGTVQGTFVVGGLVAEAGGAISDSYATGAVTNSATATGGNLAGGLVGYVAYNTATISSSFATGLVSNTGSVAVDIGGLVAENAGTISNSYATGALSGGNNEGGFIGVNQYGGNGTPQAVSTSYSTGAITSATFGGGFVGDNQTPAGQDYTSAYWDTTTSGTSQAIGTGNSAPVTGLTTSQLQSGLPSGFDPSVWAENPGVNGGFPYLIANPPPQGAPKRGSPKR